MYEYVFESCMSGVAVLQYEKSGGVVVFFEHELPMRWKSFCSACKYLLTHGYSRIS